MNNKMVTSYVISEEAIEKETIKLIKASLLEARRRVKREKAYLIKGIKCLLPSGKEIVDIMKIKYPYLWQKALFLTALYICNGRKLNLRLTFDRLDDDDHYIWKNLDIITFYDNVTKKRQQIVVFDCQSKKYLHFHTKKSATKFFNSDSRTIDMYLDTNKFFRKRYLIYSFEKYVQNPYEIK